MPILNVFRGLPGSGKTNRANITGTIVLSPSDMYSMRDGCYKWSIEKSIKGTEWVLDIFKICILHKIDISIAEVLPTINEVMLYVNIAKDNGYKINVVDCEINIDNSYKNNIHNIPLEHIENFHKLWEPWNYEK